jgi:hypothetical protein
VLLHTMNFITKLSVGVGVCAIGLLSAGVYTTLYHSGAVYIPDKSYDYASETFDKYKLFNRDVLPEHLSEMCEELSHNNNITKKVSYDIGIEYIHTLNLSIPNKSAKTIPTQQLIKHALDLIKYYQNQLKDTIAQHTGINDLEPTSLELPTSCALLVYDEEGDWINWHYDHNYYDGRFFTVLIPITKDLTSTKFQIKTPEKVLSFDLTDNGIVFEGEYVYHRASKLGPQQRRVVLSCQYVTSNDISWLNQIRLRVKDIGFIGLF